jgi:Xaa-Pro dipeptidase
MDVISLLNEFQLKVDRIRRLLSSIGQEAILLSSQTSFSWLTAARGHIGLASEGACAKIIVTNEETIFITNSIEASRLREEELKGLPIKIISYDWFDPDGEKAVVQSIVEHVIEEKDVLAQLAEIRYPLLESEQIRYEQLGREVGQIIEETSRNLKIGDSEYEIASQLAKSCISLGIDPVTNLIATDERIWQYRHPLPTGKKIERYALLAIGGRRNGLTASATRLVHFGNLSDELKEKHLAVTEVDATFISESQSGMDVGEIFKKASSCYKKHGYENEWHHHHQGGQTGYVPREYRATPNSNQRIGENQAFAWNPSISGVKSEDTILVKEGENKILTRTGEFPETEIVINGRKILRPDILIRKNYI